ncbi:S-layer homology domain-containing protein [Desulfoscipio sp. XC116]|uniref:S-layer homology domain-containing protein n=1 Tax=Desulfoscipio sp. XC116 TaxID=3144975 RepID=UPI00325BE761
MILANYAKATGYTLPVTRTAVTFADTSGIGSAYKTAVTAIQQAGIMTGEQDNKFNPKANATRAEVSSMLQRYIKLTMDLATAQGWVLNDDGQWLYCRNGKALTETQTIGGMKYFFNADGSLKSGWVKDNAGNWRFYSGKTMLVGFEDLGVSGNNKTYYFNKDGIMVAGKWLEIDGKWYYFNTDGTLAKNTKIDNYEVDENGVRKTN